MKLKNKKIHFIAAGGVGMSALAKYAVENGAVVSGSDVQKSKYTELLEKKGCKIIIGHDPDIIEKDMIVVASSAIREDNPEIIRSKELNLEIYHRSDMLKMFSDEFSRRSNSVFIAFSGTHGKTTTSGLCSYVLNKGGYRPSFVTGGIIPELNTNGKYDGDKYFIAEADESDGTIKKYSSDIAVINNLEEDHLDYYKNGFSDIAETFNRYLSNKTEQTVVINTDNEGNGKFMKMYPSYKYVTFSLNDGDYTAKNVSCEGFKSEFDIYYKNQFLSHLELSVPGKHNVYNALAVYAALKEAGVEAEKLIRYFKEFTGMGRRFQKVCTVNGIDIYDDYAHHPSEIKTTLEGVKNSNGDKRIVAIFQPHRYTRLQGLWEDFKNSFSCADKLIILDVYAAGEDKIDNVNSENFAKEVIHNDSVYVAGDMNDCAKKIFPLLEKGDIVITLGAGSVTKLGGLLESEATGVCKVD